MAKFECCVPVLPAGGKEPESRKLNNHCRIVEEQRKKRLCGEKDN